MNEDNLKLTSPTIVIQILKEQGIKLDKAYGQNFLVDENICQKIIQAADLKKENVVLEVGPGIGTLSQAIAPKVSKLWLVELEKHFIPILKQTVGPNKNIEILQANALEVDYSELNPQPNKIVSNLPYNVSAPLIMKLLSQVPQIKQYVLMVQEEMAARLTAKINTKDYSALSIKASFFGRTSRLFNVSENVFLPRPKVKSAVIKIERYENIIEDKKLFKLIEHVFRYRRKTLRNSLMTVGYSKEIAEVAMQNSHIDSGKRPQNLSLQDYQFLAKFLGDRD